MKPITIILADDHPVVRTGIRALLDRAADMVVVAEAATGSEVLPLVERYLPDVLVLDIEMPELSGVEVTRQLNAKKLPVRILALSAYASEHYVQKIIGSGAAGYLVKEEAPSMIIEAVRGIAKGEDGWMSRRAVVQMNVWNQKEDEQNGLTPREKEVLQLVVEGKTNQEIGVILHITESTVEKHVGAMMTKLQVSSRVEAAVQAVRKGWI